MAEYKLKFTEEGTEDEGRQETLNELIDFMRQMEGLSMSVVTLDDTQSINWDKEGDDEPDYQDQYGAEIIRQVQSYGDTDSVVVRNTQHLPVALAMSHPDGAGGWQGIGIDKRLRGEIAQMMALDEDDLDQPMPM
jgi:hypothetical protein